MSDVVAHPEDIPATLPFPVVRQPDGTYAVLVPPSSEPRLLLIEFYAPRTPKPSPGPSETALPFPTGSEVLLAFQATSSLPAAASGV